MNQIKDVISKLSLGFMVEFVTSCRNSVTHGSFIMLKLLCVILVSGGVFISKTGHSDTLQDALIYTYQNNPTILAARASLDQTLEEIPQAWSNFLPNLSATGSYSRTNENSPYDNATSGADTKTNTLSLNQTLLNFANITQFDKAKHNIKAQRERLRLSEQTILLEAISVYLNVIKDTHIIELRENNTRVLQAHLDTTQVQFDLQRRTNSDLAQAKSRLAKGQAELVGAKVNLQQAKSKYEQIIGVTPKNLVFPNFDLPLPKNILEVEDGALMDHPSVLAAHSTMAAARVEIDIKKREFAPRLELSASVSDSTVDNRSSANSGSLTSALGVTLTVPLFQSGTEYSNLRIAKKALQENLHTIDKSRRVALNNAHQAWDDVIGAKAKLKAFETQVEAAEVALDGITAELEVGQRTVLNLLNAEQELLDARVNLATAKHDLLVAKYTVLERVGKLGGDLFVSDQGISN